MRLRPGFLSFVLCAACSATPPPSPPVKPPVVAPAKAPPPKPSSPSRWALRPTGLLSLEAKLEVEEGTLYVGRGGARWLEKKGHAPVASEVLLPDSLQGVMRDESGKFLFAGAGGDVYVTDTPLGPIVATRTAKAAGVAVPMRGVGVGKRAIVGIAGDTVMRSDRGGASWTKVPLPPNVHGFPAQIAMLPSGEGLLLVAPQRVLVTTDDGASFQELSTPGIGARRVVADVNGELVLEGAIAAARLARNPLRFEKMAQAPASGFELPVADRGETLVGAEAIGQGHGVFVGDRWYELVPDPDKVERARLAIVELGKPPIVRQVPELESCSRVAIGGSAGVIEIGCGVRSESKVYGKYGPGTVARMTTKLFRSVDGGATFKEDGILASADRETRMWVTPDSALLVDGACKKFPREGDCYESMPIIRPAGSQKYARVVSTQGGRFDRVAFDQDGVHAYAIGIDVYGHLGLYVSTDGGKGFDRRTLFPLHHPELGTVQVQGEVGVVTVDEAGTVFVVASGEGGHWLRYVSDDRGKTFKVSLLDLEVDGIDLVGKRGLAYDVEGKAWETADGAASWTPISAPEMVGTLPTDRMLACSAYGCWVGDRAMRVGWDLPLGAASNQKAATATKKQVFGVPLRCTAEGPFQPLGDDPLPHAGNADLGGDSRWITTRKDAEKGTLSAVVATLGAKGLEIQDVVLFPASKSADVAQLVRMQAEGVVALRYAFKRDPAGNNAASVPKATFKPGTKLPIPTPKTNVAKQTVDVEIAWYLAATGKVHHATIKAAGPLDAVKDLDDRRDRPSIARVGLVSIAEGGVHVRPFASAGAADPLYFVTTAGKVEKLTWPELPTRDVRGRPLQPRLDAARVAGRSVVFGEVGPGLQLLLAAPMPGGGWESRAWGLWPELEGSPTFRWVDAGAKPVLGVVWPGYARVPATAWAIALDPAKSDPEVVGKLPLQADLGDPPRACEAKSAELPYRFAIPWSVGTRRAIHVQSESELLLASENVVVRTAKDGANACARVIEGRSVGGSGAWYNALIPTDDPAHASLFRARWAGGFTEISHQTMSCRFDKEKGTLPAQLATSAGFVE